jgi:hypothetical protein
MTDDTGPDLPDLDEFVLIGSEHLSEPKAEMRKLRQCLDRLRADLESRGIAGYKTVFASAPDEVVPVNLELLLDVLNLAWLVTYDDSDGCGWGEHSLLVHALRQPDRQPGEPLTVPYSRLRETPLENRARGEKKKSRAFRRVGCQKTQNYPD